MSKDYAKSFYNSAAWEHCRDSFMQSKYYICEYCGGIAIIAHHKQHITPKNINDCYITLNWDNLQALCIECHNKEHGSGKATVNGISFDSEGNIFYTPHEDG